MDSSLHRWPACAAYIPVLGWIYILLFRHRDEYAMFHVRQSIGLVLFVILVFLIWVAAGWLIAWIPFGMAINVMLFTIVIVAFGFGVIAWIMGVVYALQGRVAFLPIFGKMANRLPI